MKAHYDQQAKPTKYKVGQKVWIYTPKTKKGLSKKLLYKWHGPFRIVKQLSPVNFQLRTQANRLLSAPVHVNRMKLYFDLDGRPTHSPDVDIEHDDLMLDESELPEDSFASETTMPKEPVTTNDLDPHAPRPTLPEPVDSDVFEIEKILNTRQRKGQTEYLVKWVGYPSKHNSWVPESDMVDPNQPIAELRVLSATSALLTPPTIDNKPRRSNNSLPSYVCIALVIFTLVCMINGTL